MKNEIRIYWVSEGEERTGYAAFNEASTGCNAFITYEPDPKCGDAGIAFDRLDADQLPGGEAELREIWADMVAEAEASEDGRLDVTSSPLA